MKGFFLQYRHVLCKHTSILAYFTNKRKLQQDMKMFFLLILIFFSLEISYNKAMKAKLREQKKKNKEFSYPFVRCNVGKILFASQSHDYKQ